MAEADDALNLPSAPGWVNQAVRFVERIGVPTAMLSMFCYVVFFGPHSTTAFAAEVQKIAGANTVALKELGTTISGAVKEAVTSNALAQQHMDAVVRQLQADFGKVRDDAQRTREAVMVIQVELERLGKK